MKILFLILIVSFSFTVLLLSMYWAISRFFDLDTHNLKGRFLTLFSVFLFFIVLISQFLVFGLINKALGKWM